MTSDAREQAPPALAVALFLLICLLFWQLQHAYAGVFHDAGLYILQGLARLRPESLPHDVFLRFGSQDRYTLFAPLFAAATALTRPFVSGMDDPEAAAALLTLTFQVGLFAAVWALARTVMPKAAAWAAVAMTIAIPGVYGSDQVFACVEPFLTPRMAGEALALAGLAAALRGRVAVAWAFLALALLMHPLMGAAGVAAALCLHLAIPRPRLTLWAAALGAVAVGGAAVCSGAWLAPTGPLGRFDPAWLALVQERSPYLFLSSWRIEDWGRLGVTMATLTVGAWAWPGQRAGILCRIVLVTTAAGLALTYIGCDRVHWVPMVRLQPWRWQWLGTLTAAALLPLILRTHWNPPPGRRATVLILAAAWIFGASGAGLAVAALSVAVMASEHRLNPSEWRLAVGGAWALVALAVVWRVASNLQFTESYFVDVRLPMWLRRATSFGRDGSAAAAVVLLAWWLAEARRHRRALGAAGAVAACACLLLLPHTLRQWTNRSYPTELGAQLAPWRLIIPPRAEVFWPDSPPGAWLLLDRPHYLSEIQTSGMIFSRDGAIELQARANRLKSFVSPAEFLDWNKGGLSLALGAAQLKGVCDLRAFDFLVTGLDLGREPAAILERTSGARAHHLYLYRCSPQARAAAAAT